MGDSAVRVPIPRDVADALRDLMTRERECVMCLARHVPYSFGISAGQPWHPLCSDECVARYEAERPQ